MLVVEATGTKDDEVGVENGNHSRTVCGRVFRGRAAPDGSALPCTESLIHPR